MPSAASDVLRRSTMVVAMDFIIQQSSSWGTLRRSDPVRQGATPTGPRSLCDAVLYKHGTPTGRKARWRKEQRAKTRRDDMTGKME